jgi:hypothetical protein
MTTAQLRTHVRMKLSALVPIPDENPHRYNHIKGQRLAYSDILLTLEPPTGLPNDVRPHPSLPASPDDLLGKTYTVAGVGDDVFRVSSLNPDNGTLKLYALDSGSLMTVTLDWLDEAVASGVLA